MSSFTFNFKDRIILVFVTCFMLVIYSAGVVLASLDVRVGQNQSQDNRVRVERFLFRKKMCKNVLVGSSLLFRLEEKLLGEDYCNVALAGGSALTGLELIKINSHEVETVFVEINILRKLDEALLNSMKGASFFFKKNFLFFQDRYQPMTLVVNVLKNHNETDYKKPTNEQFDFWVEMQKQKYSKIPEDFKELATQLIKKMKVQIEELQRMGIVIRLIEAPMHKEIILSARHQFLVSLYRDILQEHQIEIVPDYDQYETDDGLHLNRASVIKYSAHLKSL